MALVRLGCTVTERLFSPMWYRIAELRPRLRNDCEMHAHVYRGRTWYVLVDAASSRSHRFSEAAHYFIELMDGELKVEQLWQKTEDRFGETAPTQDEALELLSSLHAADLIQSNISPDADELLRRSSKAQSKDRMQRFANPMSIRFGIVDPAKFLNKTIGLVSPLFSKTGFVLWLAVVLAATLQATRHWEALTDISLDELTTPGNLLLIWLVYPVVKLLHELGHAYAARRWGCEVHEMGIMFLVLMPLPYVDASKSAGLPDKRGRIMIAAMGIMVELFMAALAMFIWTMVEPGTVKTLAYSIMLISGISTLLFNGNPLLRFDGYYMFADALEIPNLATRSSQYLGYLVKRYLFGVDGLRSPAMSADERGWLVSYAIGSFIFRYLVLFGIVLLVASKFFVIGLMLAAWAIVMQVCLPLVRQLGFLFNSPQLAQQRSRAVQIVGGTVLSCALLLFALPLPLSTSAEGVVWAPDDSEIRAAGDAVVTELVAEPNAKVKTGDVLLRMSDPELQAQVAIVAAELREIMTRYNSLRSVDQVESEIMLENARATRARLKRAQERLDGLTIRSPANGMFLVERPQDMVGRYVNQGDLLGFVADLSTATIRVAVIQEDMGLIRENTERIDVRFADRPGETVAASVSHEVPASSDRLPSAALGVAGGGQLLVNPNDEQGTQTIASVFHIELELNRPVEQIGGRTYVRFSHGYEPLGGQWYRRLRQLFLRQFDV
jgi:putative peptide zinc metalloprotease protein